MTERRLPGGFNTADQNDLIQKGAGGFWFTRGANEIIIPGRFLARIVFGSGTGLTHTLNTLTTKFRVYGQGPGGGASGADGQGFASIGIGTPGGSGAFFDHIFTVAVGFPSFTYTVGQGGAGGSGNGAGSAGSANTQVTYNSVTVGGGPGLGANNGENAANTTGMRFPTAAIVNGGAVVGSPDIGVAGQSGTIGFAFDNFSGTSGIGGHSVMGYPGAPRILNNGGTGALDGNAGKLGAGGSPGIVNDFPTGTSVTGGAGGSGILVVEEFS